MVRKKKTKKELHIFGHYAFLVGAVLAIVSGLLVNVVNDAVMITTLVLLGVIVGLLNITAKETEEFLVAALALMLAGIVNLGIIPGVGIYLRAMLSNIVVFVVPAAIIVALRAIYNLANK